MANLILDSEVQLWWPFLRMRNGIVRKNSLSKGVVHLPKLYLRKETSHVQLC